MPGVVSPTPSSDISLAGRQSSAAVTQDRQIEAVLQCDYRTQTHVMLHLSMVRQSRRRSVHVIQALLVSAPGTPCPVTIQCSSPTRHHRLLCGHFPVVCAPALTVAVELLSMHRPLRQQHPC